MLRLEVYGIVLVILVLAVSGAYFKGRSDGKEAMEQKQLVANAKVLQESVEAAARRAAADNQARQAAEEFIERTRRGLVDVNAKFAKLPNVVTVGGCPQLGDNFRLRWDAAAGVPGGPAVLPTWDTAFTVPIVPLRAP